MNKCKCTGEKPYKVVFDASKNIVNDEWLLCSECINEPVFQNYRISTNKIEDVN